MSGSAAAPDLERATMRMPEDTRAAARVVAGLWWLWLAVGIAWIAASLVILQFDQASITTIGIIVGIMFVVAGVQQLALAAFVDSLRWLWALFGVLFVAAGVICFVNPKETFAGLADILGFLFLCIATWWIVQAFLERDTNGAWWFGLIAGVAMIIMAFWTSGQFFLEKAYVLLVFAGIWALMQGVGDIIRAFQVRSLRDAL
ncbi:MAG TPA: DUF308 domain-containing protein [Capillimicrobium sp.]|nr:DUF308 domain-containing protein [Capillimicrobium sp.]